MYSRFFFFFFNDTATTEIYTLSLHDALPIWCRCSWATATAPTGRRSACRSAPIRGPSPWAISTAITSWIRSEEHTSELQSLAYLVCRLLLEKKKKKKTVHSTVFRVVVSVDRT